MISAQEWLDKEYPLETRNEVKELTNHGYKSEGIESMNIKNRPKLRCINVMRNGFKNLEIVNCPRLCYLSCSGNKLVSLDASKNPNLEYFYGDESLETSLKLLKEVQSQEKKLKKALGENEYQTQIEANCPEKFL